MRMKDSWISFCMNFRPLLTQAAGMAMPMKLASPFRKPGKFCCTKCTQTSCLTGLLGGLIFASFRHADVEDESVKSRSLVYHKQ